MGYFLFIYEGKMIEFYDLIVCKILVIRMLFLNDLQWVVYKLRSKIYNSLIFEYDIIFLIIYFSYLKVLNFKRFIQYWCILKI